MSAKKSWDVERSPAKAPVQPAVSAAPRMRERKASVGTKKTRTARVETTAHATRPHRTPISKEPLKVRRARAKRIFLVTLAVLGLCGVLGLFYVFWLPALRIQTVTAEGPRAASIIESAQGELSGTHLWIVPRNSLFFIPEGDIRARILEVHPEVMAVSFKSSGLTGLHVVGVPRMSAFLWCGESKEMSVSPCYDTDPDGLIFSPYTGGVPVASSTLHLRMYAPIDGNTLEPVRGHIKDTASIPNALQLARALKAMNANIAELALRADEADFYTTGGTRITYVIGRERAAVELAASSFPQLSLNDGSIEYVDLRFEGKIYLKRHGEPVSE